MGKVGAGFTVLVMLMLSGALALSGVRLVRSGEPVLVGIGVGVVLLVVVGLLLVAGEVRLGAESARLARVLEAEGGLPYDPPDVTRLPSGRLERDDADRVFALRQAEVEASPEDWRAGWRLAAAYGEARDARRGRRAMRRAVALERATRG